MNTANDFPEAYLAAFRRAQTRLKKTGPYAAVAHWHVKAGAAEISAGNRCVVFKLQRPAWSGLDSANDDAHSTAAANAAIAEDIASTAIPARRGIFFAAWLDARDARALRLRYNIHALKLRELPRFTLESRRFAAEFRARFSASLTPDATLAPNTTRTLHAAPPTRAANTPRAAHPHRDLWPNVSLDFGPQNLMEGWMGTSPALCETQLLALAKNFLPVAKIVDALLALHAKTIPLSARR